MTLFMICLSSSALFIIKVEITDQTLIRPSKKFESLAATYMDFAKNKITEKYSFFKTFVYTIQVQLYIYTY